MTHIYDSSVALTQIFRMTWKYWDEKTNDWSYLEQGMNFDLDSDSLSHSTNEISFEIRKKNLSILTIQEY